MIRLLINFLTIFGYNFNKPARLEKKEPETRLDKWCNKAAPYIILIMIIIIGVLLFITILHYGHNFSTEANNFYYNMRV